MSDWTMMLTAIGCLLAFLAILAGIFLHLAAKIDKYASDMAKELRDFHGRLERQDAEFKAHMVYYHHE